MTSSSFLHVANGSATTDLLEAAGVPGARTTGCDVLYEGPVPSRLSDAELLEVRARFLADDLPHLTVAIASGFRELRREILDAAASEIVLWYEHDLFDQLNLIQLLSWISTYTPDARVSLVSMDRFPGRSHFKGFGELTPDEIAPLFSTRIRITEQQYELASLMWIAFRYSAPVALDKLRSGNLSALPFLAAALTRFLEEFPWTSDGLSRSERRLLEIARDAPIEVTQVFPRMHEGETAYYITDGSLATLVETLSSSTPSLLTRHGYDPDGDLLNGSIALTDAGREVLSGQLDRIALCGIDRWLGGVHLEGNDVWRWDDARRSMTHA
jgi:hypothetical protein